MSSIDGPRPAVLLLAGDAGWEATLLPELDRARLVVLRRCVDESDLMAAASAGLATVAVVAAGRRELDAEVVGHLLRHGVRSVAVSAGAEPADAADAARLVRLGVVEVVAPEPAAVVAAVLRAAVDAVDAVGAEPAVPAAGSAADLPGERHRVIAVWGPAGAPGRSTIAVGLAAELAHAGTRVQLVDADPYGGSVAQLLGVLDESSGLLGVARAANNGLLDADVLVSTCRRASGIDVLTGLPRAERRTEVRPGVLDAVLGEAALIAPVVVDCGFCLEDDVSGRDRMTLEALHAADEVVVVGAADPVGLVRLVRGLVDLGEAGVEAPVRVVLNRMRPTLGWRDSDVVGMLTEHVPADRVHVVPEDRSTADRALVAGRPLADLGDSPLRRGVGAVAAALFPGAFRTPLSRPGRRRSSSRG